MQKFFGIFLVSAWALLVLPNSHVSAAEDATFNYKFAVIGVDDPTIDLPAILNSPEQHPFIWKKSALSEGREYSASWLKFLITQHESHETYALQFYYSGVYELHYFNKAGQLTTRRFGRLTPVSEWDQSEIRSSVTLKQDMDLYKPFYVKISQQGIQPIGHRLMPLWELKQFNQLEGYFWGAIIGLMILAMLTGLVLFGLSKGLAYLFFAGICASALVWTLMNLQIAKFLHAGLYEQDTLNFIYNTVIATLGYCIVQFMRFFIDFRRFIPRFDRFFGFVAHGYIASYMLVAVMTHYAPQIVWPMHVFSLFIFVSGLMAVVGLSVGVRRRDRTSVLIGLAWIPGSSIAIVSVPTYYGLLPGNWWTEHIVILGLALAIMLFSVAIADQVLQLRQQRNTLLKVHNEELQNKVAEQTAHLLQTSEKIEQQRQTLATTLSYKEDLLANIAHELKTPLTLILGVLRGRYSDSERQLKLSRLVFRISHLLDNMLDLSKHQSNNYESQLNFCYNAHEFVEFYVTTYRGFVPEGRLVIEDNQTADVYCAQDALDKIITNLINNAIKYSPHDTPIRMHASVDKNQWHFVVENAGKGIAKDKLDSIFERYVRVGEADQSFGLGLGLPLVKQLVEQSQGKIQVDSQPDQLTRVAISLPLATDHQMAAHGSRGVSSDELTGDYRNWLYAELQHSESPKKPPLPAPEHSENASMVYCIDDNVELLRQLQEQLGEDYRLECFENPIEALAEAEKHIPDLIISDVMMPQLSGFDVVSRIRSNELTSHVPIVLLTARSDEQSKTQGLVAMADDYITKPYEPMALTVKIDNLIAIRQLLRTRFSVEVSEPSEEPEKTKLSVMFDACPPEQKRFMQKIIDCFEAHMADPEFSIKELSEKLFLSDSQIRRKVKAISGYSPQEVLRIIRLEAAAALIREGESLKAVAHDCGFSSQSHMGSAFKAYFGQTPNTFRSELVG